MRGLSLVAARENHSLAEVRGLLIAVASLVAEYRVSGKGFSNYGIWAQ